MTTAAAYYDFDRLFDVQDYLYFMAPTLAEENTPAQCDFIESALALQPGQCLLDLGCGHGRHANELARRGYEVLGVDIVDGFVQAARADAEREGLTSRFVHGDLRELGVERPHDAAICLFDAFGYFDDAGQACMLERFHAALHPGARLLLDIRTREYMTRLAPATVLDMGNGDLMIDRHRFDIETGRLVDLRTTLRAGVRRDVEFSIRLYAYTELRTLLQAHGFTVLLGYGGYDGAPLSVMRPRTLVLAQRD